MPILADVSLPIFSTLAKTDGHWKQANRNNHHIITLYELYSFIYEIQQYHEENKNCICEFAEDTIPATGSLITFVRQPQYLAT